MPIFHDHYETPPRKPSSEQPPDDFQGTRYPGNGFGGQLLDSSHSGNAMEPTLRSDANPDPFNHGRRPSMFNRVELIERIKRGNSPAWPQLQNHGKQLECSPEPRPKSRDRPTTPLLPPAELKSSRTSTPDPQNDNASAGYEIERPRSALHSGDFREKKEDTKFDNGPSNIPLSTSPVAPWHHSFPAAAFPSSRGESQFSFRDALRYESRPTIRSRAASQSSFSSSFVFMPPTSPLVQQSNNTDLDFSSRPASRHSSKSPDRSNRRHTFPPHSFQTFKSTQMARSVSGIPAARHLKRESNFPYQAHQPRRSLTSLNQFQPRSTPQTPLVQPRRPSFSSDASPLHHAPMVGSYEESILRGRMSTTPSRPLNFVAQIGVLGKGQCKSNLRCPAHVTVPFPAVFYSYNSGNGRITDNSPSPYVGLIDLEHSLSAPDEGSESSRRKRRHTVPNPDQDDLDFRPSPSEEQPNHLIKGDLRRREKMKRRSTSPKSPPGGSYRIPQQGQLQIVIKNPNKTAVKLFLVPYDLSDMEPGQKTFIRQRSYSAGPIIDMPLSSRKNFGTDRPEAALSNSDDPNDRPVLRYLIHLHICCPSKGRFFLYKAIRVVFANRVPDGKEKLRNEIQLPEPRYSTYKPTRDSLAQQSTSSAAAQLTAEKAFRRRSAGFSLAHQSYDRTDRLSPPPPLPPPAYQFNGGSLGPSNQYSSPMSSIGPIPFSLTRIAAIDSRPVSRDPMDLGSDSPFRPHTNGSASFSSPMTEFGSPISRHTETFDKLSKGDVGYGGNAFCGVGGPASSPGAGLLARRLRGLDVQYDKEVKEEELL
ncbi:hypothetical protein K469DRAFT_552949 [Zopfia rhizophila CBS 207.26]|uniref:Atos-like conserved domain-containing protein n=1 Tax=Zopfia rhizophila CBS 207.26 TaxID=1314779 RepID=A0A6A6ER86_9PEZI|nr:hypothetical protein K469DRAFT_552949 [Zopfia rhizophila CBS 207.26]